MSYFRIKCCFFFFGMSCISRIMIESQFEFPLQIVGFNIHTPIKASTVDCYLLTALRSRTTKSRVPLSLTFNCCENQLILFIILSNKSDWNDKWVVGFGNNNEASLSYVNARFIWQFTRNTKKNVNKN
jgi:hypothetical protein